MPKSVKDLLAGLAFIAFGLAFGYAALGYELGTALRMGPGYFPLVLAGILVALGIGVIVEGMLAGEGGDIGTVPWRGAALILGALVFFGYAVQGLGLAPTLFVTVFLAALASQRTGIPTAALLALALTAFCIAIFVYGLGVTLPLVGPWLPV
ncbi:tripartite tricarboxylate transporter TctB family protein [Propylenella binzhouense]|uniref:Tripartite tricarboxylate transporter TctB family protein n=1 Tax=Propylenella binzhouense TaxID=2555902 RepID=A0A964T5J4_9HYPH|nr:tripartite tricarboxylate transporter TctB family protein [Propylenella binzhouense]MYZ48287.1 tripartite tricarboxylate transporter TctB family protein [Propylenella binzhouense]